MLRKQIFLAASIALLAFALFGCSSQAPSSQASASYEVEQSSSVSSVQEAPSNASAQSETSTSNTYSAEEPQASQPYVREGAWWVNQDATGTYVYFAVLLASTDDTNCYTMMPLTVTAKDSSGAILATETFNVTFIAPSDVMPYAGLLTTASIPEEVSFDLSFDAGQVPGHPYTLASFAISNDSEQAINDYETRWTGEVTSHAGLDFPGGYWAFAMLYKGNNLVGGYGSYSQAALADGATIPFSVDAAYVGDVPEHDSYKLYVLPDLLMAAAHG